MMGAVACHEHERGAVGSAGHMCEGSEVAGGVSWW